MTSRQPNSRVPESRFLFDSLGSKAPSSSRKVHIRRLVDILQVSVHRHDWPRAQRAWCILARCKEFDWKEMWKTGLLLVGSVDTDATGYPQRLEFLRVMMLRSPEHRIPLLQEIILHLIISDRHQDALDELELYLPSFPYQDNPVLHIYAGLLRIFLAQASRNLPHDGANNRYDGFPSLGLNSPSQGLPHECKSHFQRALDLDPENPIASGFIERLTNSSPGGSESEDPSGIEFTPNQSVVDKRPHKKRRAKD